MVRVIAILTFAAAMQPAWAQGWYPSCIPFEPSSSQIADLLAQSNVPATAALESSCYRTFDALIGNQGLIVARQNTYRFSWPTGEAVSRVAFFLMATCTQTNTDPPRCANTERLARWRGAYVSFDPAISSVELIEVLREMEKRNSEAIVTGVSRLYMTERSRRYAGLRRYHVTTTVANDRYGYTLEVRCTDVSDCRWTVSSRGIILYDVLP